MTEQDRPSILRRKAAAQRAAQGVTEVTAEKAMFLAAAHAGDMALGVAVAARDLTCQTGTAEEMTCEVAEGALFLRLTSADGAAGVAALCGGAVAAAIEAQLLGAVSAGEAPQRSPTDTDAALLRGFLDCVLHEVGDRSGAVRGLPRTRGFKAAERLPNGRAAAMCLAEAVHERFTTTLDFGRGSKTGTLTLILPMNHMPAPDKNAAADWGRTLERTVLSTSAMLEARFARLRLPLSQVRGFEVGQVVPLTGASLDKLDLRGAGGTRVARVRLGRSGSMRAVRLGGPLDAAGAPRSGPAVAAAPAQGTAGKDPAAPAGPLPSGDLAPLPVPLDAGAL